MKQSALPVKKLLQAPTDGASQMIPERESASAFLFSPGDEGKMGVCAS